MPPASPPMRAVRRSRPVGIESLARSDGSGRMCDPAHIHPQGVSVRCACDERRTAYLPALRWKALTPLFDAVVRVTARETAMKERLLDQAGIAPGRAVLDLGAGTGTLAIRIKQRCPTARVVGLDADRDILAIARSKAAAARCESSSSRRCQRRCRSPPDRSTSWSRRCSSITSRAP